MKSDKVILVDEFQVGDIGARIPFDCEGACLPRLLDKLDRIKKKKRKEVKTLG